MTAATYGDWPLVQVGFDLHDGPLQDVAYVLGQVRALRSDLAAGRPREELQAETHHLEGVLAELEGALRRLASSLTSTESAEQSFRTCLAAAVARFERRSGLPVELDIDETLDALPADHREALVGVATEALENVRKHSRASRVVVEARRSASGALLEVRDDGIGSDGRPREGRLGLLGMTERMRRCGGALEVGRNPDGGTRVRALFPPS